MQLILHRSAKVLLLSWLAAAIALLLGPTTNVRATDGSSDHTSSITWGATTNGLRAGLAFSSSEIRIDSKARSLITQVSFAISNVSSNRLRFFWAPEGDRDEITLTDSATNFVPRVPGQPPNSQFQKKRVVHANHWQSSGFTP